MHPKKVRWIILLTNGLFLLTDQILKWQALHNWAEPNLISKYFGWQLFLNKGVAFGLPLSNTITIIITLPMVALVGYLFCKELSKPSTFFSEPQKVLGKKDLFSPHLLLAWSMIFAGAVSNLLDRIIYHQVIDYLIIGTAIINFGDILIVGGLLTYLLSLRNKTETP